jgi:signal transduction histidine kinase/ActR/RegA family two-component response regulator
MADAGSGDAGTGDAGAGEHGPPASRASLVSPAGDAVRAVQAQLDQRSEQFQEACRLAKLRLWEVTIPDGGGSLADLMPPRSADFSGLDTAIGGAIGPVHPDDREAVRSAVMRCLASDNVLDFEFRTVAPGRRVVFWRATGRTTRRMDGSVGRIGGVCQDVSDRREAELAVQQTEKWKSLGQLTGGIAHDFNNLLTVISTNLEMLVESIPDQPELLEFIEPARKAANSGADLTARLLAFAQRQPLRPELVRLGVFLPSLRELAVRTIGGRYTIEVSCPPDVAPCRVDRAQLEGALLNLIVNARDAMPAGGRIAIAAHNLTASESPGVAAGPGGHYVRVSVTDEGGGIAPEIIDRVFEPFFTTKAVGKGTGLGLSMVQGFAQQSGGQVVIASRTGQGTLVALDLPGAAADASDTVAPSPGHGSAWLPLPFRTLVVDDAPDVLRAMMRMCTRIGLLPVPAGNADEALALLRGVTTFDLLLTDVILPGRFGGADVAREARRLQPAIRTLYTSGYTHADIVNHAKLDATVELLVKPFTRQQLLAALRAVMTGRTPAATA